MNAQWFSQNRGICCWTTFLNSFYCCTLSYLVSLKIKEIADVKVFVDLLCRLEVDVNIQMFNNSV